MFGYTRDKLVGEPVEVLVPDRFRGRHRGHRTSFFAGPSLRPMGAGRELMGRRSDGSEFPVEISLSPIATDQGVGASATIRDATERRRAEEKFRGLLESAPDAMVIVGSGGRIALVNRQAEQLFGYEREDLLDQPVEMLIPQRFRAMHPGHRDSYFGKPGVRPMGSGLQLYGLRSDDTELPVGISLSPLQTEEGTLVSAAIRDVTERKAVEDQLQAALELEREAGERLRELDGLKDEFLSTVSHELRTPLTAIAGFAHLLLQDAETKPELRDDLMGRIRANSMSMQEMIEKLLDYSRLQAGKVSIDPVACDLSALITDCVDGLPNALDHHELVLELTPDVVVVADRNGFARILGNLLTNAAKYSPRATTIRIKTVARGRSRDLRDRRGRGDRGGRHPPSLRPVLPSRRRPSKWRGNGGRSEHRRAFR